MSLAYALHYLASISRMTAKEQNMVTLKYRLVGNTSNPVLSKEFKTRNEAMAWAKAQGNVLVLEIESTGTAALSRIFG